MTTLMLASQRVRCALARTLCTRAPPHRPRCRRMSAAGAASGAAAGAAGMDVGDVVAGLGARVAECNTAHLGDFVTVNFGGGVRGYVTPEFAAQLLGCVEEGNPFETVPPVDSQSEGEAVRLDPRLATFEARTEAVERVVLALADAGVITGWRGERYPVTSGFGREPRLSIERAAASAFGVKAYGVHVNAYTTRVDDSSGCRVVDKVWVARRSLQKSKWPGMLDHLVAGGQPMGISLVDNVVKEAGEEAGVPEGLARAATRAAGAVSYLAADASGRLGQDVLFCFDMELPADFLPTAVDGEVESFELMPVADVLKIVATTREYKPNCALVLADFFVRHGIVSPDAPGYLDLVSSLRQGSCQ